MADFSHLDSEGTARMVDVGEKSGGRGAPRRRRRIRAGYRRIPWIFCGSGRCPKETRSTRPE